MTNENRNWETATATGSQNVVKYLRLQQLQENIYDYVLMLGHREYLHAAALCAAVAVALNMV